MNFYINEINKNGTIAIDDSIIINGVPVTYGSKMLENFVPLFDAEVVTRLKNANYSISGKTNVGEFGLDFIGETSNSGFVTDESGKLMGAAALLVKTGKIEAALNVDVNGTPRRAAAFADVNCMKPTYAAVSRYGVIPCACSGEQVCVTANSIDKTIEILSVISGHDPKDGTSMPTEKYEYSQNEDIKGIKIAVIKEYIDLCSEDVKAKIDQYIAKLKKAMVTVDVISIPEISLAKTAWYILSSAEVCNNLSRYDGVKFGHRANDYTDISELYTNSRTEGFGSLAKTVILYGSDVLSKERYNDSYDKAMKVRRVLQEKMLTLFKAYKCVLMPVTSKETYSKEAIGNSFDISYNESAFTALASLIGTPALVTHGVQLMGNHFDENTLFSVAATIERTV